MTKAAEYKISLDIWQEALYLFGVKKSHDTPFWRELLTSQLYNLPTESFGDWHIEEAIERAAKYQADAGHYLGDLKAWLESMNVDAYARFLADAVVDLDIYGVKADLTGHECIHLDDEASAEDKAASESHFEALIKKLHLHHADLDQLAESDDVPVSAINLQERLDEAGCAFALANRMTDSDSYESDLISNDQDLSNVEVDWKLRRLAFSGEGALVIGSIPNYFTVGDQTVHLEQVDNNSGGDDETVRLD